MSEQKETRRSFLKDSVSKGIIATNVAVLAGLINTPGAAHADATTQPGTTQPATQTVIDYIEFNYPGPAGGTFYGFGPSPGMALQVALSNANAQSPQNPPVNNKVVMLSKANPIYVGQWQGGTGWTGGNLRLMCRLLIALVFTQLLLQSPPTLAAHKHSMYTTNRDTFIRE